MRLKPIPALLAGVFAVGFAAAAFGQANEDTVATGGAFPLAAPAGADSHALDKAPPGAVNQGKYDMDKWKYGHAWDAPPGAKIWNPVKLKMMEGKKVVGGTLFAATDASTYCAMANAGYDFIWTEMQHNARSWGDVQKMWRTCPYAKAVPGVRVAYTDEREEQHALDAGALVLVVPTVRSYEEAIKARDWAYFPPLGKRSNGGGQAFELYKDVPGGYRATINNNLVLVLMIETLDGLKDADRIAKIPGVTAIFAASGDLGNFAGYKQGDPDYEREINIVHDAAMKAGVRLCGPLVWRDRPDFTCFQGGSETGDLAKGAHDELGALADTQGKPQVGPWAPGGIASLLDGGGGRRPIP
jgi:2-keto-3-deoxy-L-rhamnonate aldolase RhmA